MFLIGKTRLLHLTLWASCFAFVLVSCSPVRNFQPNKPFVFENKIIVTGDTSKDEIKRLTAELNNYWDDSAKAQKVSEIKPFAFTQAPIAKVLRNPPVFDSINVERSKVFMNAYLNSQGYYYATFKDTFTIKEPKRHNEKNKHQLRTTVTMNIDLGKNITIDSVSYTLTDSLLQSLAMQQFSNSLLKKGKPYTKQIIADELDRLVAFFRQKGYYKFTREDIYALVDTANEKLFKLTLDPIEQAKLIAEADKRRRENPTWDIDVRQREIKDSSKLSKYYVGNTYYYPETKITDYPDSLIVQKWARETKNKNGDLIIRDHEGKFRLRPLREHTYLRKYIPDTSSTASRNDTVTNGEYNEELYLKTLNTLSQIPAWKQVDARIVQRGKDTLDIHLFLEPAIKQNTTYNLEASRNSNDFSSGNLLGLGLSTTYTNRNVWKQATQSSTSLRAGIELNFDTISNAKNLIQTFQVGLTHSYTFPRLIAPRILRLGRRSDNKRTVASASASYIERFNTYRLRQLTGSFSWEWQKKKNAYLSNSFSLKPFNIELYKIDTLPLLDVIFKQNPFLRNSFNTGNVIGASFTQTKNFTSRRNPNNTSQLRYGVDESGYLLGVLPLAAVKNWEDKIYQYVKLEVDYKFNQKRRKSEIAYHFFGGLGIPLGGQSLPFFKQFSAGGPNSMRAWGLRQLGLGSSIASDTIAANSFRDRFGDMQLETNIEYRFLIASINGFKIASALYADIGNVWNVKKDNSNPGSSFSFNHLAKDIAVGVGTGLRFDFTYFLIRVDFAYKVKDPGRDYNNGWMSKFRWTEERSNQSHTEVRNFAFQLGIGLPF